MCFLRHDQVLPNRFANGNGSLTWFMKPSMAISLPFFSPSGWATIMAWTEGSRSMIGQTGHLAPAVRISSWWTQPCLGSSAAQKWASFLPEPLRVWVCCLYSRIHLPQNHIYSQKYWHPRNSGCHVVSSLQNSRKWWKHHTRVLAKTHMLLTAHVSLSSWSEST